MKISTLFFALLLASFSVFADSKNTTDIKESPALIKKESPYSVNDTMNKFEAIIKKKGFTIFARIDHQKNAESIGLDLDPAQVIIFGNPKGGTLLMKTDIAIALDLPLRVAVYKAQDGKVYMSYHTPETMSQPYQLKDHKVIDKITKGLDKLTSASIAKAD